MQDTEWTTTNVSIINVSTKQNIRKIDDMSGIFMSWISKGREATMTPGICVRRQLHQGFCIKHPSSRAVSTAHRWVESTIFLQHFDELRMNDFKKTWQDSSVARSSIPKEEKGNCNHPPRCFKCLKKLQNTIQAAFVFNVSMNQSIMSFISAALKTNTKCVDVIITCDFRHIYPPPSPQIYDHIVRFRYSLHWIAEWFEWPTYMYVHDVSRKTSHGDIPCDLIWIAWLESR